MASNKRGPKVERRVKTRAATPDDYVTYTCLNCITPHSWTVRRDSPISAARCPERKNEK